MAVCLLHIHSDAAYIDGTVNDPTPVPPADAVHGSYHWDFERFLSVSLIPLCTVGMVKHGACGLLDASLLSVVLLHSHTGFDAILTDYLHKRKFPVMGPLAKWMLRGFTVATAVGMYGTYLFRIY